MASPGGKEVGRLAVKVVPDTDGFTAKVKAVAEKAEQEEIDLPIDLDTGEAEEKIRKLTRRRKVRVDVDLNIKKAEAKIKALLKNRKLKLKLDADTKKAQAQVDRAARDRTAKLQLRFTGEEAARRVRELAKDKVQRVKVDLDDKNAKTKLRVLGKNSKIIAELEVDEDNLRDIKKWVRGLGPEFKKAAKELSKGVDRTSAERARRAQIKLIEDAHALALREQAARTRAAQRAAQALARQQRADQARITREAVARYRAASREQDRLNRQVAARQERIYRETGRRLQRQLRQMGSDFPDRIPVEVDIDPHRRMLAFRAEIERLERERINLEVSLKGLKGVATRIKLLARDRRMKIRADIDRNQFGRTGYFIGKVFKGGAAIAAGALGGVFRSLSLLSSGLGNVGNVGQKVFGRMADGSSKLAGNAGKAANMISNIVGALLAMTLGVSVIFAIVTALGALIVAAIGAVAVLASVLVGALALLAIPAIFAGIAIASVSLANKNDDLRKSFVKLKDTVTKTVQRSAKPMLDFFTESIEKLNKALKVGSPLYKQISTSFSESTKALKPLRSGLMDFGTNTLSGVNAALKNLNQGNTMSVFSTSLGNMGATIGNFAGTLSSYAPDIATSFTHLTSGLNKIGVSVANWIGKFSGGRASQVIDSFSEATTRLFDAYANNSNVYMAAAENLGDALGNAVPGVEKITAAFAKMSPGIFNSLADGINKLGNAVSDPGLQSGLSNLTSMMIDLTANILTGATKAAGTIGNFLKTQGDLWDMWTGHLYDNKRVTTKMFEDLIKSEGSVRDKVNKGLQQLNRSVLRSTHDDGEKLVQYANSALVNLGKVEGGVSKHVTDLGGKLQKLAEEWKNAGGKVGQNWYDAWKQASQEVDKSGNETLMKTRDQMNGLVNESLAFRNRLKANLIQAFQSQNIPITDGLISQIDQALGLVSSSAETKSKEAVANIQRSFALLPGIIQTAMNEAKTPEQLQKKLMDVQKVMDTMTPQIAQAFAKLPTSMQETLAKSATAFTEWTALETFRSKVTTTVDAVVQQFDRLPSAIGGSSGVISGLVGQFGGAAASIQGFNAQANWANWILNQIGAQAAWAGWQMGQIGVNAGNAAGAVSRLNTGANGLQGAFQRAGISATDANAKLQSLGTGASTASGRFSVFSAVVSGVMARAQVAVAAGVAGMISDLLILPPAAARAGNLSAFVSSIQGSMARAQAVVANAVADMLSQLSRLNTTVTARVNVETNKVPTTNDIVPNVVPNFAPFSTFAVTPEFSAMTFDAPTATTFDAQASSAGEALAPWGRSVLRMLREERSGVNSGGVTKNYYYTINAAPNVPTEKQLVKAQRFSDNLYGE